MEFILSIISQNWVGTLLTLVALFIALYQTFKSRDANLRFQYSGQKLISEKGGSLPTQVKVTFSGKTVPRLTLTQLVLWNSGRSAVRGLDIAENDPIMINFDNNVKILKAEIISSTREAIRPEIELKDKETNKLNLKFDFIDRNDGVLISILHTSEQTKPIITGTVIGMPKGLKYAGRISPLSSDNKYQRITKNSDVPALVRSFFIPLSIAASNFKYIAIIMFLASFTVLIYQIFPELIQSTIPKLRLVDAADTESRKSIGLMACLYMFFAVVVFIMERRPFPDSLSPETATWSNETSK